MVSTYGTTVKMLQNTVHHGLILRKVSINDKDNYKTVTKNITHMVSSLFPHRIHCNERELVYLCMQYRSLPLKKILEKVLQISEHMLLCMM